jgi:hypothetical protein
VKTEDRQKFLEIVVGFAELKGKQLSAPALELFWNAMQPWSIEDFTAAANQLIRTCGFMPTPKDFEDLRKAGRMTAGEAWALVRDAARCGGECPDDPDIYAAVRALGGIRTIGMMHTDQMPFLERRFAEHYEAISERQDVRESVPQIAGQRSGPYIGHVLGALEDRP